MVSCSRFSLISVSIRYRSSLIILFLCIVSCRCLWMASFYFCLSARISCCTWSNILRLRDKLPIQLSSAPGVVRRLTVRLRLLAFFRRLGLLVRLPVVWLCPSWLCGVEQLLYCVIALGSVMAAKIGSDLFYGC